MASAPQRILVTRPAGQGPELAARLRALGMEPILLPTIEIAPPASYAALDAAIAALAAFHWLLFTSANAVEAFANRSEALQGEGKSRPAMPLAAQVAAIGLATARALEAIGLVPSLVPPRAVAESLAEALLPYARQPDGEPTRFLLVRAEEARELLPESLRAAGAVVTIVPAYRTVVPEPSLAAIRKLFSCPENYPDAISFTSSSSVQNFFALLAEAGSNLPPSIRRVSIGPITSGALARAGFPPHVEAAEPAVAALAAACLDSSRESI